MSTKHNKKLHQLPLFWAAVLFPISAAAYVSWKIYLSNQLGYSYDSEALKALVQAFQIPLGLAGLSIPLVAVVGAIHRSDQTSRQIAAQASQNNFANHFKHLEEFKKVIIESGVDTKYWRSVEDFHRAIYPHTINGDITPAEISEPQASILKNFVRQATTQNGIKVDTLSSLVFFKMSEDLSLDIVQPNFTTPRDLISLLVSINKAVTFSGVHDLPFNWTGIYEEQILKLNAVAEDQRKLSNNLHIIEYCMTMPSQQEIESRLTSITGTDEERIRIPFYNLWTSLTPVKQDEILEKATEEAKDWLDQQIIQVIESQLGQGAQ